MRSDKIFPAAITLFLVLALIGQIRKLIADPGAAANHLVEYLNSGK
jgi:hypothetical protein